MTRYVFFKKRENIHTVTENRTEITVPTRYFNIIANQIGIEYAVSVTLANEKEAFESSKVLRRNTISIPANTANAVTVTIKARSSLLLCKACMPLAVVCAIR